MDKGKWAPYTIRNRIHNCRDPLLSCHYKRVLLSTTMCPANSFHFLSHTIFPSTQTPTIFLHTTQSALIQPILVSYPSRTCSKLPTGSMTADGLGTSLGPSQTVIRGETYLSSPQFTNLSNPSLTSTTLTPSSRKFSNAMSSSP